MAEIAAAARSERFLDGARNFKARRAQRFRRLRAVLDELLGDARAALGKFLVDGRSGCRHGGGDLLPASGESLAHGNGGVAERLRRLFARGRDLSCNLTADAAQSLAHALAIIGQRLALARKFVDEVPDPVSIFRIGTLQRRDLVMDQRLKLARPAKSAGNGVVHRRDLAPHRLPQRGNRLLGHAVGLGEPDRDLGHRRGHQAQLLRAPDEDCQEPEQRNRNGHGRDNRDNGGIGEHVGGVARGIHGLLEDRIGYGQPKHEPNSGGDKRNKERRPRRPLLKRVDQPPDGGHVVIGGDMRPRGTSATLLRGGPAPSRRRNLNGIAGRLRNAPRRWCPPGCSSLPRILLRAICARPSPRFRLSFSAQIVRFCLIFRSKIDGRLGDRLFLAHQAVLTLCIMSEIPPTPQTDRRRSLAAALRTNSRQLFIAPQKGA